MIAILKYNAGNSTSVKNAVERLGFPCLITNDHDAIKNASKVIFPGVGAANSAMSYLKETGLDQVIVALQQPVLGICLGMQLLCNFSEEGAVKCLGIFDQNVVRFKETIKVPQIGWNTVFDLKSTLFNNVKDKEYMYFVHSYYVELGVNTIATTNYSIDYSSAIKKNNFYGMQFHPEKSSVAGQVILENFINLNV